MTIFRKSNQTLILSAGIFALLAYGQTAYSSQTDEQSVEQASAETSADATIPVIAEVAPVVSEAETAALALFDFQEGDWTSEWTMFDATGSTTGTFAGTVSYSPLVDEYTQQMTHDVPQLDHMSVGVRGFNKFEDQIVTFNMAPSGVYWVMRQDPVSGVTVTEPHKSEDGTVEMRRFTRFARTDDTYKVVMELSLDSGETWFKRYNQILTRVTN